MWKSADLLPALIEMLMTPKAPGKQKLLENLFCTKRQLAFAMNIVPAFVVRKVHGTSL